MNCPASNIQTRLQSWLVFSCNIIALCLFSIFAFTRHAGLLLVGNDGPTGLSLAEEQSFFYGITPHLHGNMLEGLNNLSIQFNLSMMPGYLFASYDQAGMLAVEPLYTWFAVQLFLCVLLIGWNYGFATRINYVAAWLLTILFFPYFETVRIYPITGSTPHFVSLIIAFALMCVGVQRMGKRNWLVSLAYGAVFLAGLIEALVICPAALLLIAPALMIVTMYAFISAADRDELQRKAIICLAILMLAAAAGWIQLFLGLILDTAATFFNADMSPGFAPALVYASILFQGSYSGMAIGPWLFAAGMLGALVNIYKRSRFRLLAITIIIAQLSVAIGGAGIMYLPKPWSGPAPVYCEVLLFPFYALFAAYLMFALIEKLPLSMRHIKSYDKALPFALVSILTICLIMNPRIKDRSSNFALPPSSTAITKILENNIALRINQPFSGRVANILPQMDWVKQVNYFSSLNTDMGNDQQTTGLWLKHIPTLHEYNQLITPGFYSLYRRLLSDGADAPYRSWSNFNRINIKMLQLLGVRFILTTVPELHEATHRAQVTAKTDIPVLHLFELNDVNTSGISATDFIKVNNINQALDVLDSQKFNLHYAVVIPVLSVTDTKLVPATSSQLIVEKGGFRLIANSLGSTLLILPIEYSHCLSVTSLKGAAPEIMRIDVALLGVLFNKEVDVKIDNRTGPFASPRCRWQDYREFKKLWENAPVA